ncbi:DUF934 domain-containing protein [Solimonas soli]|uniref:DUF934 domain-containing protein n=1 Tax=Solimonas soli TaxID=413479 RepID=UPI0004AD7359|nr:DUF934 domain-containing protein [Solimonas soli]
MSTLIRNGQIQANDALELADDASDQGQQKIIVSLARWTRERETLAGPQRQVAVRVPNTVAIDDAWPLLKDCALIVLEFPSFGDGRAYSQARVLRGRFGYAGEIRATGQAVVRDQLLGMHRVGINSFVLRADQDPQTCLRALADFDLAYQESSDDLPLVRRLRASQHAAG